ncbi:hypothetical protein NEFER03_1851 [Nematocida sp. LUAm3]|nr:hypothetical protein NEFER03_1851 [Nematocida sp. LUAm3]KAI5173999.1 hypothetical protein NEFER02_0466 [Nematocida sp. LUAm2]KAI5177257.1 hypothetical protein NEFER01_0532 [Nematocida sp. LUAm1]
MKPSDQGQVQFDKDDKFEEIPLNNFYVNMQSEPEQQSSGQQETSLVNANLDPEYINAGTSTYQEKEHKNAIEIQPNGFEEKKAQSKEKVTFQYPLTRSTSIDSFIPDTYTYTIPPYVQGPSTLEDRTEVLRANLKYVERRAQDNGKRSFKKRRTSTSISSYTQEQADTSGKYNQEVESVSDDKNTYSYLFITYSHMLASKNTRHYTNTDSMKLLLNMTMNYIYRLDTQSVHEIEVEHMLHYMVALLKKIKKHGSFSEIEKDRQVKNSLSLITKKYAYTKNLFIKRNLYLLNTGFSSKRFIFVVLLEAAMLLLAVVACSLALSEPRYFFNVIPIIIMGVGIIRNISTHHTKRIFHFFFPTFFYITLLFLSVMLGSFFYFLETTNFTSAISSKIFYSFSCIVALYMIVASLQVNQIQKTSQMILLRRIMFSLYLIFLASLISASVCLLNQKDMNVQIFLAQINFPLLSAMLLFCVSFFNTVEGNNLYRTFGLERYKKTRILYYLTNIVAFGFFIWMVYHYFDFKSLSSSIVDRKHITILQ